MRLNAIKNYNRLTDQKYRQSRRIVQRYNFYWEKNPFSGQWRVTAHFAPLSSSFIYKYKHIVTPCSFLFCSGYSEERPEVPMLFRDVPSLLIIFVLTMPQPLRRGAALVSTSRHTLTCQPPPKKTHPLKPCPAFGLAVAT